MKRILWALPFAAACALVCATAYAADPSMAQDLPHDVSQHWVVLLAAAVIAAVRTSLSDDTIRLPVWAAKSRVLMISTLGLVATSLEQIINGLDVWAAVLGFAIAAAPSLLQEFIKKIAGAEPPKWSVRPPPMPPTTTTIRPPAETAKLLALAVCAFGLGMVGCAALRTACTVIDLAKEGCDLVVVKFPDGTTETVRREDIAGVAMQARAARLSAAAKASVDAGADR